MLLVLEEGGGVRRARFEDYMDAIYAILNLIPLGFVTSYGDIGELLGVSPRLVGLILSLNKGVIVTPCHRVVRSDGTLGGYSGPGGVRFKRRLLELEGVRFEDGRVSRRCFTSLKSILS